MPFSNSIYVDKALSNVSSAYRSTRLIADILAPRVNVMQETGLYYVYTKDSLIVPPTARANGAVANESTFYMSTASYRCQEHALKELVTDRDRANADPAVRLDADTTEYLTEKILLKKEVDLAALCGTAANWANTTSLTSTFAWSANTTLSNPIAFMDSAASTIALQSGMIPNVAVLDDRTFRAAKEHVSVIDRIKYTSADSVTEGILAKLFNLERVLVAGGIVNTGQELVVTSTSQNFIWTDMAFVAYVAPAPALKTPSALYQFTKNEFGNPFKVKKWREEERGGDFIEASTMYQHKVVASDAAYLIVNTVQ